MWTYGGQLNLHIVCAKIVYSKVLLACFEVIKLRRCKYDGTKLPETSLEAKKQSRER